MNLRKRIISLGLAVMLALSAVPVNAAEPLNGLGQINASKTVTISPGTELTVSAATNLTGDFLQERVIELTPGYGSTPVVAYGNRLYGFSTASYVSNWLAETGRDVVAAINGDFFMTDTGIPIGLVVTDGVLRSSDNNQNAVGFRADGSAFIGKPTLTVTASTSDGQSVKIDYVNKSRKNYGTYLLTPDFSATTRTTTDGVYIVVGNVSGSLKIGSVVSGTIQTVAHGTEPLNIAEGTMILTATTENDLAKRFDGFVEGQTVEISITAPDPLWNEAVSAVGGGDMLVRDGVAQTGLDGTRAPRTAIGVTESGNIIMYTVDGRQRDWSVGFGLNDLAKRMQLLGCVTAMNLDGGGSTAMIAAQPGNDIPETITRPSDGKLRQGANYILIANDTPTGPAANLHIYGAAETVLAGGKLNMTVKATDANLHPANFSGTVEWGVSSDKATIQNGVLTAGDKSGAVTVTAKSGAMFAQTEVRIVGSPDVINLEHPETGERIESIVLQPGEVYPFNISCLVDGERVYVAPGSMTIALPTNVGTYANGAITAANFEGYTGTLTITVGSTVKRIRVTVGTSDMALETFEGTTAQIEAGGTNIRASIQTTAANIYSGKGSGKITYDFPEDAEELSLRANWEFPVDATTLHLRVMGDGSANELSVVIATDEGRTVTLPVCTLNFRDYRLFTVTLPQNAAKIVGLSVLRTDGERSTGTFYLDQLTAGYTQTPSITLPTIADFKTNDSLTPGSLYITAKVSDGGMPLRPENITATLDGRKIGFIYDAKTCELFTVQFKPNDKLLHRLTITAEDADGNIVSSSQELDGRASGVAHSGAFADADGHWSAPYADSLYKLGVLDGNVTVDGDGRLFYRPSDALTRAEFAVMMTRSLGIDAAVYSSAVLPYSDTNSIPEYAKNAVAAMFVEGIITGKSGAGGDRFFDPNATITRAEIMTIIGRTIPKGYTRSPLNFSDTAQIPEYAAEYISLLVGIGAASGYSDGTVRPNAPVTRAEGIRLLYGML